MELAKLENAIVLSTILNSMGKDNLEEYVELETLRLVVNNLNKVNDGTTPEKKKEAITNLITRMMNEFMEK